MNDYTFEEYDDPRETRAWYERFLREHNGGGWRRSLRLSIGDLLTGNFPKAANGESPRVYWYRIKFKGDLVGYADAKTQPCFNSEKVISDMWILPKFRKQGHFHGSFRALVEYSNAVGICIRVAKYRLYGGWFESFGFDWLTSVGDDPGDASENSAVYVVTRNAYKNMIRFLLRYRGDSDLTCTERGRLLLEEVQNELDKENACSC
jgi:hypothetical protein